MDQAAQPIHPAGCRAMQHLTRAQKKQRLEHGVVQRMQQRRTSSHGSKRAQIRRAKGQGQAKPHRDQPDIFDGGTGQQRFGVFLQGRAQRPHDGRGQAKRHQHRTPKQRLRRAGQVKNHARQHI